MIRVLITEPELGMAEAIRRVLYASEQVEIVGFARDGLEAAQMAVQSQPDVLIVHADLPGLDGSEVCRMVSLAAPQVACLLLVDDHGPSIVAKAMRAGARAVLSPELGANKLMDTVIACAEIKTITKTNDYAIVTDPRQTPTTIAFLSAKGGVGKTTLAANIAVLFAQQFPDSVVLIDMYAQLGDICASLNIDPRSSLLDLATSATELDSELVEEALSVHKSTLRVLAGCTTPQLVGWDVVSVPYITSLLAVLRRSYRFVFWDLPPMLWSSSLHVLSRCQQVPVITNLLELSTLRATGNLVRMLVDDGYTPRKAIKLIVNRVCAEDRFSTEDLEKAATVPVAFTVPNDVQTTVNAANKGEAFVLTQPKAAISHSLKELAALLLESTEQVFKSPGGPRGRLAA